MCVFKMLLFEYLCMYVWLLLVKLNYILKLIIIRIKLEILAKCLKKAYPNSNWKKVVRAILNGQFYYYLYDGMVIWRNFGLHDDYLFSNEKWYGDVSFSSWGSVMNMVYTFVLFYKNVVMIYLYYFDKLYTSLYVLLKWTLIVVILEL